MKCQNSLNACMQSPFIHLTYSLWVPAFKLFQFTGFQNQKPRRAFPLLAKSSEREREMEVRSGGPTEKCRKEIINYFDSSQRRPGVGLGSYIHMTTRATPSFRLFAPADSRVSPSVDRAKRNRVHAFHNYYYICIYFLQHDL